MKKIHFLLYAFSAIISVSSAVAQEDDEIKWTMFTPSRFNILHYEIIKEYPQAGIRAKLGSMFQQSNLFYGMGFYRNFSNDWAASIDGGVSYGRHAIKGYTGVLPARSWMLNGRMDVYRHFTAPSNLFRPFGFAAVQGGYRGGNFRASLPVGAGVRFLPEDKRFMVNAQIGYGVPVTTNLKGSLAYSAGLYINFRRRREPSMSQQLQYGMSIGAPSTTPEKPLIIDTDGDGVVDEKDSCTTVAGPVTNAGCPVSVELALPGIVRPAPQPAAPQYLADMKMPDEDATKVEPQISGDTIRFVIYFEFDRYGLTQHSFRLLSRAVDFLKRNDDYRCELRGYTDLEGEPEYNDKLSDYRVRTARNYLISFGITSARITSKSFGMNNPSIYNTDRALTWMNRRVEILFIKE